MQLKRTNLPSDRKVTHIGSTRNQRRWNTTPLPVRPKIKKRRKSRCYETLVIMVRCMLVCGSSCMASHLQVECLPIGHAMSSPRNRCLLTGPLLFWTSVGEPTRHCAQFSASRSLDVIHVRAMRTYALRSTLICQVRCCPCNSYRDDKKRMKARYVFNLPTGMLSCDAEPQISIRIRIIFPSPKDLSEERSTREAICIFEGRAEIANFQTTLIIFSDE